MKGNKEKMNKLSSIGLGMAIGLTWGVAVVGVGIFAQHMLASGYNGSWPPEVINSVVLFKGLFSFFCPCWFFNAVIRGSDIDLSVAVNNFILGLS